MVGVVFSDESEAKTFYKKVNSKKADTGRSPSLGMFVIKLRLIW